MLGDLAEANEEKRDQEAAASYFFLGLFHSSAGEHPPR